ncbi:hypothetical protein JTB14_012783 [Gonioctena quinquepunctata]|nr:hypothetical protein JTB14_012783 [Gonioctena quinquepunctata]
MVVDQDNTVCSAYNEAIRKIIEADDDEAEAIRDEREEVEKEESKGLQCEGVETSVILVDIPENTEKQCFSPGR